MNTYVTFPLALFAALTAGTATAKQVWGNHRLIINDPFYSTSWFDEIISQQREAMEEMDSYFKEQLPTKEQQEAIKKAQENLAKIKLETKEVDGKALFTFSGFENLDKKDIEIEKKKYGWIGTITTKDGIVEFAISSRGIELTRHAEVRIEEKATPEKAVQEAQSSPAAQDKAALDKKAAQDKKDAKEVIQPQQIFYSSSYTTEAQSLKHPININTLKVDGRTATSLTLSADKIKKETLHIP